MIHEDGTYLCSLFRVRFGKTSVSFSFHEVTFQILSRASGNRMVTIKVNDIPVEQKMRVGSDGEAYFLSELMVDENGDNIGSPLGMSPASSMLVGSFCVSDNQNLSEEAGSSPAPLLENQAESSHSNDKSVFHPPPTQTLRDLELDPRHHQQAGPRRHFPPHAADPQYGDHSPRSPFPHLLTQESQRSLHMSLHMSYLLSHLLRLLPRGARS